MSNQYSLYPTSSAAGTEATAMAMGPPLTPISLSTRGRSSTSTSSVSLGKGSTCGSTRGSTKSKASVGSRKEWMEAPLPVGVTIGGRGMWYFLLFVPAPLPLPSSLYPAQHQLTRLTCSIPLSPYLHRHTSPIHSILSQHPIPVIAHPR